MSRIFRILFIGLFWTKTVTGQDIWAFTSIVPSGQTDSITLPSTHCFQVLGQTGDTLSDGSLLPSQPDFTGFVPTDGSSLHGLLSVNHELYAPLGGLTVFDADFDTEAHIWALTKGGAVDFSGVPPISRPCSGTVTRWGNVISGEELATTADVDSNGYHDVGWLVETNPTTREVVGKLYKAGKMVHENAVIAPDDQTMYFGGDDAYGFIYKFVADIPTQMQSGKLFVLSILETDSTAGIWLLLPNSSPQECNNVRLFASVLGAKNFGPIEDVDIAPDGKIYFANKSTGRIYRFRDVGLFNIVTHFEVFVQPGLYTVETPNGAQEVLWGNGSDNLAFDNDGNLWVCHDAYAPFLTSINYLWVVGASHTTANPNLRIFLSGPAISESTGLTFSPDNRFMFLSFQVINNGVDTLVPDVTGALFNFNRGTTIVVARREILGPNATINLSSVEEPTPQTASKTTQLSISPTPTFGGDLVTVSVGKPIFGTTLQQICDLNGKIIWQQSIEFSTPTRQFQVKIPDVPKGKYILNFRTANNLLTGGVLVL